MRSSCGWYPVSLSEGLEAGRSAGTRLFDKEFVIWRDADGAAHVWEDRCPHRGMRLSFGFVRGSHIACIYHGWQYDANGQCQFVPAHPALSIPSSIRVATYPCVERLGIVWMYSDSDATTTPELTLDRDEVTSVRSLYIDRAPAAVLDHLEPQSKNVGVGAVTLLSLDAEGQRLLAAVQPFGVEKTALHIVLPAKLNSHKAEARRAAAMWAEDLRRHLEEDSILTAGPTAPGR
ncbi:MAG: Rieske (2Fe-2S) protein [Bradyrhizobiaceae bacterium]|nr:Rieske (2Fe-2S) protein [Bradyrhizobiaceae bacterium]